MMIFNNIFKTIVLFFVLYANFKNVVGSPPQLLSFQYDVLVNLTTNIGQANKYTFNNTLGYIDFCDQIQFMCWNPSGSDYQIIQNIYLENTESSSYILLGSDFIELSKFEYMRLSNFKIDKNLSFVLYETVTYLYYYDCELTSLEGKFPEFFYITQNTKPFSTSLQVSQLINSGFFTLNETSNSNLINVDFVNDLSPGETISSSLEIIVTLNDFPDLTNVYTGLFSIALNNHFTSTPNYGNLATYSYVGFFSVYCAGFVSTLNFSPFNLMSSSSIKSLALGQCNFINVPTSISFPNLPLLTNVGFNDPFDSFANGDDILPITNNNIKGFSYVNGKLPNFNDLQRFYSFENVALQNNQMNTNIPDFNSDQSNIYVINLSENGLTGSIPESYCTVNLIARNNSLSGIIPNCMKCYWDYMSYYIDGNSGLTNFNTVEECTTLVPNIYFNKTEGYLYIFGTSLGFTYPFIVDEDTPNFFVCEMITINSKFKCLYMPDLPTPKLLELQHLTGRNFTFSVEPTAPLVSNVTVVSISNTSLSTVTEYQFKGVYFGYNVSVTSVSIGGELCQIQRNSDTSFYSINCTVTTPINAQSLIDNSQVVQSSINASIIPGNWHIIQVTINGLQQEFTIDSSLTFNPVIPCTKKCGRYCDFQIGLCVSNCLDPTCSGGRGVCNEDAGVCTCKVEYAGANCTLTNQYASSVIEAPQSGGQVIFTGLFGNVWAGQSVTINGSKCAITNSTSTTITCTVGPLTPGTLGVTIIQNGITWSKSDMYILIPSVLTCLNNCYGTNGVCNTTTSLCKCNSGWYGNDCSSPFNPHPDNGGSNGGVIIPPTNSTVNNNGSTSINNEKTNYQISIPLLIELDLNQNTVQSYPLNGNWALKTNEQNTYTFGQTITQSTTINGTNNFVVSYTIQEITTSKTYSFAGYELDLEPGAVKISVAITNYQYLSSLNSLQLQFYSTVATISDEGGECNDKDTTINNNNQQITNYINIQRDSKTLQARFLNRIESDGIATTISSQVVETSKNSITIGLNLPHCTNCFIDPDFSVLISPDFKSDCGDDSSKRAAYVIPVAVVASVIGVSTIGIVTYYIIKKRRDDKLFNSLSSRALHD